jgi:glycine/D-amino acid oxidase-like deaminating enzyme
MFSPKPKIAVIGCGAFGALSAIRLSEAGFAVTVYERLPTAMAGASYNNQNRLHLGYHYPRSDETCQQCISGFQRFVDEFPDCVRADFTNGYFIASQGSHTDPAGFIAFCQRNGLTWEKLDLARFPMPVRHVDLAVTCPEYIYDSRLLGEEIIRRLERMGVAPRFGDGVTGISPAGDRYLVTSTSGETHEYDGIVNATYANMGKINSMLGREAPERQYEYTVVAIVETGAAPCGVTIMDGPFFTLLPFGKSGQSLFYGVSASVIATEFAGQLNPDWLDPQTAPFQPSDHAARWQAFVEKGTHFFPTIRDWTLHSFLQGPRMVLPHVDATDKRPSLVEQPAPNVLSLFSGKIDHAIWVADEVVERFTASLKG